ncbi:MAG: PilN domain-containing protein [Bryobacterales bacterium]|nr:PilN domain-containing protein [Bryobacterales bacterium]
METIGTATVSTGTAAQGSHAAVSDTGRRASRPAPLWKRIAASGSGVGIVPGEDSIDVLIVRVRPGGVKIVAYQRLSGLRERGASDAGVEYARFLRTSGVQQLPAWVLLPREEVIVRTLSLPGVPAKDLDSAVALQLESLHPYEDESVRYGFRRIGNSGQVLIGIAREDVVDRWIGFFEEAGIKLGGFTFGADALYRGIRCLHEPEAGFGLAIETGDAVEVYGESASRPIYDALLYEETPSAVRRAISELRLDEHGAIRDLAEMLPAPASVEQAEFAAQQPWLYLTALGAAATFPTPSANLLPAELRKGSNWTQFLPTLVLIALLALLVAGMYGYRAWEDRQYAIRLTNEVQLLERQVAQGQRLDNEGGRFLARLDQLREYRQRTTSDLDALLALTRLLPADTWVTQLDMNRDEITLAGEAARAGDLIGIIDASPLFEKTEFAMPLQRVENHEVFRLRIKREAAE